LIKKRKKKKSNFIPNILLIIKKNNKKQKKKDLFIDSEIDYYCANYGKTNLFINKNICDKVLVEKTIKGKSIFVIEDSLETKRIKEIWKQNELRLKGLLPNEKKYVAKRYRTIKEEEKAKTNPIQKSRSNLYTELLMNSTENKKNRNKNKNEEMKMNIVNIEQNIININKEHKFSKELPNEILTENLSPLGYLNKLTDTSFLVENKPRSRFGVNIELNYNNPETEFPQNYPYGLGFKPLKFTSELYYDDKQKIYNFTNRETHCDDQKYSNIRYMLKNNFTKDIYVEARYLAYHLAEKIWKDKFFYTMNICPLILKYLNEQTDFWKTQYNIEYDKRKK